MTGASEDTGGGSTPGPITGAAARSVESRAAKVGHTLGRGARAAGHGTVVAGRSTLGAARRASHSGGAGGTGLSRLIETHALHNAGDAVVAVSLAGSLFFTVPTGEARGQVALFLLLTLLPFSVLAPLVGPFLDRVPHGRRWAIGATTAIRALLCLVLAFSIAEASWWQFPAALAILIASKAYNVTRSTAAPRLLPEGMTLTSANARMSMAGVLGAAVAAPVAVLLATLGPQGPLAFAFLIFTAGTVRAITLPARVDSDRGEQEVPIAGFTGGREGWRVPAAVVTALRANAGLRMLSGFLTIYLAFLFRTDPPAGWEGNYTVLIAVVIAAAGVGSALGTVLGARTRALSPSAVVRIALVVNAVAAVLTALAFGMVSVVLLMVVVGTCQQVGKFALDATIQEQVGERRRTSVFGRSETLIQVSWVAGGALAVVLPTDATIGLGVVAALMVAWLGWVLLGDRRRPATVVDATG